MKICFLAAANSIHSIRWISYFVEQGYSVLWISLAPPSEHARDLIKKVSFHEITPSPLADENGLKAALYVPSAVRKVKEIIERECPHVMHVHSVGTYGLVGALSGFKKIVMTPWGSDILLASPLRKILIKKILKTSKQFTCDGQNTFDALVNLGVSPHNISLIRFGTNTETFQRTTPHEDKNSSTVISLRNFDPIYNVSHLIRSIPLVLAKHPHTKFVIVGTGSEEKKLKDLVDELNVRKSIHFTGRIPATELPKLLNKADIYVSTSLSDSGLAASTAEAMSCELPVVATNTGDNIQWVISQKGGFLVEPNDDESLAKNIIELIEHTRQRKMYGEYNRALILEKNDYQTEMKKVEKIYNTMSSKRAKKLLAIANIEHASPRIPHLLYYLSDYGWESTLVTPQWNTSMIEKLGLPKDFEDRVHIETAPYKGDVMQWMRKILHVLGLRKGQSLTEQLREKATALTGHSTLTEGESNRHDKTRFVHKLLYLYQTFFAFPDTERTWRRPALKKARKILSESHFSALLSSSPFGTSHRIVHKLQKEFHLPWTADFRDPWVLSHNYPFPRARFYIERSLEKKTLANAIAITTASHMYSNRQRSLHNTPIYSIYNGFDPAKNPITTQPLSKKLTILFTGSIYEGKQRPELFLKALADLKEKKKHEHLSGKMSVQFYGKKNAQLEKLISQYELGDIVEYCGMIDRTETLQKQHSTHILLLFGWEDLESKGIFQTKLFEYFGARRPILICGGPPDEEIKEVVHEAKAGWSACNAKEIEKRLEEILSEYSKTGTIAYHGIPEKIEQFSYPNLAGQLNKILNSTL